MARRWRVFLLLFILALVAALSFSERLWVRSWSAPLALEIYPVAADAASTAYVDQVTAEDFRDIADFIRAEAPRWRKKPILPPVITVHAPIRDLPPRMQVRSGMDAVRASLGLRWYAFRHAPFLASVGRVRLFVLYHRLEFDKALPDSMGMQKGLIGVAHVYASDRQRPQNAFVIAHELLHTLGATDKYGAGGQPLYPAGIADLYADPLYPQQKAEIMAGRIPLSAHSAEIPRSLAQATIGYVTASEIGW